MSKAKKSAAKLQSVKSSGWTDQQLINRILLFFFLLCFLLYGRSIGNRYAMDDEFVTYNNTQIHKGFKAIPEIFRTSYVDDKKEASYEYRPLVKVTFAIEYGLFGENPHVSHVINILFYFLNIVLLFRLLLRLLKDYHVAFPFLITLLFLVHPLHSEVVLSLKNRDVMLSFLGSFLALSFYLKYADTAKLKYLLYGAFFMLFALLSKKDSITFFVIIPLAAYFFTKAKAGRIGLITLVNIAPFIVYRMISHSVVKHASRELVLFENPFFFGGAFLERIPMGLYSLWYYIKMFILPHPLLAYYGYNQVPVPGWTEPGVLIAILLLAASAYFLFQHRRSRHVAVFGMLYFFITISMFLNIVIPVVGIVAERFAYIPSVGLCVLAAWGILKMFRLNIGEPLRRFQPGSKWYLPVAIICLIFSIRVIARNPDWKDHYTLYRTDVKKAPESAHLHTLYAAASLHKVMSDARMPVEEKRTHVSTALKHYKESIRIIPDYITSHNNVGMIYYNYYNKPEEAIPYLKKAIILDTNYTEAYFNLASCLAATGDTGKAEGYFLKTIELNPKFTSAYYSLSGLYAKQKRFDKVLQLNQSAIDRGERSDVFYINLANVHYMQGDTLKAVPLLEQAISLNANNRAVNSFLANYYKKRGEKEKEAHYFQLMNRSSK